MSRPNFTFGAEVAEDNNYIEWPSDGNRIALLDGDMIPYIIGYTISDMTLLKANTRVKDGQSASIKDTPECKNALDRVDSVVNSWVRGAECDAARIFMTDSASNFRVNLAFSDPYKGQRKEEKPPFFYEMREYLIERHKAFLAKGYEADDAMSIHQWTEALKFCKENGCEPWGIDHRAFANTVIVSADKDLMIVPGYHLIPGEEVTWVEPLGHLELKLKPDGTVKKLKGSGLKFFYAQMVTGDTIDNYKGIPRKGARAAYDMLAHCKDEKSLYMAVLRAYKEKFGFGKVILKNYRGGTKEGTAFDLMLEAGRLAHMAHFEGDIWRADKNPVTWGNAW